MKKLFGIIAVVTLLATFLTGCGENKDNIGSGDANPSIQNSINSGEKENQENELNSGEKENQTNELNSGESSTENGVKELLNIPYITTTFPATIYKKFVFNEKEYYLEMKDIDVRNLLYDPMSKEDMSRKFLLNINDVEYEINLFRAYYDSYSLRIVDLDPNDNQIEIGISNGSGDDFADSIEYYSFDGEKITYLGHSDEEIIEKVDEKYLTAGSYVNFIEENLIYNYLVSENNELVKKYIYDTEENYKAIQNQEFTTNRDYIYANEYDFETFEGIDGYDFWANETEKKGKKGEKIKILEFAKFRSNGGCYYTRVMRENGEIVVIESY